MATTIQIKRSSTASGVPLATDLAVGELAVNLADKRLFTKQSDGTIIELSTNPTDLDAATLRIDGVEITASATELNSLDGFTGSTAELNLLDGLTATTIELNTLDGITASTAELNKLDGYTGSTAELNILDGVTATTAELNKLDGFTGTVADLNYAKDLRATGVTTTEFDKLDGLTATTTELNYTDGVTSNIQTQLNGKATSAQGALADTAVQPNDNVTFGTGIFSGEIAANGGIALGDNDKATFGTGDDLQIYHDGSNSIINEGGTGDLKVQANKFVVQSASGADDFLIVTPSAGVDLRHNTSGTVGTKLATTSTGVDVTGTVTADGLTVDGNATFNADSVTIADNIPKLVFEDTDTSTLASITANSSHIVYDTVATSRDHIFKQGGTTRVTIDDTGVDVIGTVTADGLTVDDAIEITGNQPALALKELDTTDSDVFLRLNGGNFNIETRSDAGAKLGNRITADSNGDVKFYENTGTTAKMVWDASSELLILNSPSGINLGDTTGDGVQLSGDDIRVKRTCTTTTQGLLHLNNIGVQGNVAEFYIDGVQTGAIGVKDGAAMTFISGTGNTERMRISSGGNVGIGTASPSAKLEVAGTVNAYGNGSVAFQWGDTSSLGSLSFDGSANPVIRSASSKPLVFQTNGANERARIDSSGNAIFGKTTANNTTVGTTIYNDNGVSIVRDANPTVIHNRLNSDGDIEVFRKDGTTVGSIGTTGGDITIGSGDTGVRFDDGTDQIYPVSGTTTRDAAVSLGWSGGRFKDLYLSGGVIADGTDTLRKSTNGSVTTISGGNATNAGANYSLFGGTHATLANVHRWRVGGSEVARIDSSGNLLVGKTSTSSTVKGVGIYNSGLLSATVDGDIVATLKRLNSDGEILRFRKDGSTVGSIGVVDGNEIYINNGSNVGLRTEQSGDDRILPCGSNGAVRDSSINLGAPTERFGHLFLGGGVYLGGTGSANKLDDYEEGTWDIHIKDSHDGSTKVSAPTQGRYTKIGNIVHLIAEVYANGIPSTTFVGYPYITLPFNVGSRGGAAATTQYLQGMGAVTCGFAPDNQSQLRLATDSENPLANIATGANIGGTVRFYASVTYRASA